MDKKYNDEWYDIYIYSDIIRKRVKSISSELNTKFKGKCPTFLPLLKSSIPFATDIIREFKHDCYVDYITNEYRVSRFDDSFKGRDVIIVLGIVDNNLPVKQIIDKLNSVGVSSITTICLLFKPQETEYISIDYVGFEFTNEFVIGYGLDIDGKGRNWKHIYRKIQNNVKHIKNINEWMDDKPLPIKLDISKELTELKKLQDGKVSKKKELVNIIHNIGEDNKITDVELRIENDIKKKLDPIIFKYVDRNDFTGAERFVKNSYGDSFTISKKRILHNIGIMKKEYDKVKMISLQRNSKEHNVKNFFKIEDENLKKGN